MKPDTTTIISYSKRSLPTISVTDPRFIYVPYAATDITKTWRRFGWMPLSEKREVTA